MKYLPYHQWYMIICFTYSVWVLLRDLLSVVHDHNYALHILLVFYKETYCQWYMIVCFTYPVGVLQRDLPLPRMGNSTNELGLVKCHTCRKICSKVVFLPQYIQEAGACHRIYFKNVYLTSSYPLPNGSSKNLAGPTPSTRKCMLENLIFHNGGVATAAKDSG